LKIAYQPPPACENVYYSLRNNPTRLKLALHKALTIAQW
jgi:hypothetical protein